MPDEWINFGRCEKCGATVPRATYVDDGKGEYEWDGRWWGVTCRRTSPHFHLRCWRCGWKWETPDAD